MQMKISFGRVLKKTKICKEMKTTAEDSLKMLIKKADENNGEIIDEQM